MRKRGVIFDMRLAVRLSLIFLWGCAAAVCAVPAEAQNGSPNFVIQGVVLDSTRAALVGARVEGSSPIRSAVGVNDDRPERRILPSCERRTIRAPDRR